MEVFALLNICSVSLLSLVLDFQLVAQELSLRVLQTVFHHLYHVQPRKVYPKEASEMVAHEAHAS